MTSLIFTKKIVIFGCGNTLFGDDGFGPAVVDALNSDYPLPEDTLAVDAGTAVRDLIFDLVLTENKPETVWIIDAVTMDGKSDGDVFEVEPNYIPSQKKADFSLHQCPSSDLLQQLKATGVNVRILGFQTPAIPNIISPGLSCFAKKAVPVACRRIIQSII